MSTTTCARDGFMEKSTRLIEESESSKIELGLCLPADQCIFPHHTAQRAYRDCVNKKQTPYYRPSISSMTIFR